MLNSHATMLGILHHPLPHFEKHDRLTGPSDASPKVRCSPSLYRAKLAVFISVTINKEGRGEGIGKGAGRSTDMQRCQGM